MNLIGEVGAGLKLFTKFNKIYHRLGRRVHAENFIVWCIPSGVLMKRDGDEETFVCNSDHLEAERASTQIMRKFSHNEHKHSAHEGRRRQEPVRRRAK